MRDRMSYFQSLQSLNSRIALKSATWYYEHLGGQKPIVVVTEDEAIVNQFGNERHEVFFLRLGDYLKDFWPSLSPESKDVYAGLVEAKKAADEAAVSGASRTPAGSQDDYQDYYKTELVEAGIRQGKFFKGRLYVDKYHASQEAFVVNR